MRHVINGVSHGTYQPVPVGIFKKGCEAAASYDWTTDPQEIAKIEGTDPEDNEVKEGEEKKEYPKKVACRKTGIVATLPYEGSPVVRIKNEVLTMTADEQIIKSIIE